MRKHQREREHVETKHLSYEGKGKTGDLKKRLETWQRQLEASGVSFVPRQHGASHLLQDHQQYDIIIIITTIRDYSGGKRKTIH